MQTDDHERQRGRFSRKLSDILNFGALNLAMGIGYRLGLFDVLDAMTAPAAAPDIARAAGLNDRYVAEWLGVMACGGVVDLQRDADDVERFSLPRAHGDLIAERAGNGNLGVYTQEIPLLTRCAMDHVERGFRTGEGVGYDHYPDFQQFMGLLADAKHRQMLVGTFLPSVDDGRICRRMEAGIDVCDVGCGQGLAIRLMARAYPRSRFTGIDIVPEAIETARAKAAGDGLENTRFVCLDAAAVQHLPAYQQTFDYITAFDAIHDQTQPLEALQSIHAMLAPGGCFSMIDITADSRLSENCDHPMGPFLYTVSLMHCMPVGLADGGRGLGMMWGRQQATAMLAEAGFADIRVLDIPSDPFNTHYFCRQADKGNDRQRLKGVPPHRNP